MKIISADKIKGAVCDLCIEANSILRSDVLAGLKTAFLNETKSQPKNILSAIIANARIALNEELAICQDTGMPCIFVEIGSAVKIAGDLKEAINKGVEAGYKKGFLRKSVIRDPLLRGSPGYTPAIIHIDFVKGNKLKLTVLPKGFGCENKAQLKMFKPTAGIIEIKNFIVETVKSAGPDACPPYVIGVGIGGTADYACLLAKKALLRELKNTRTREHKNQIRVIEADLLRRINALNIGPMGLGGGTSALGVNIETYPTHIAGLPVCVNISCYALRSATRVL